MSVLSNAGDGSLTSANSILLSNAGDVCLSVSTTCLILLSNAGVCVAVW